jgi:hypothetical protein
MIGHEHNNEPEQTVQVVSNRAQSIRELLEVLANGPLDEAPFAIYSRRFKRVTGETEKSWLEDWERKAPPAKKKSHWQEGHSAMELARYWFPKHLEANGLSAALSDLLAGWDFRAYCGLAECRGGLDGFAGNSRNHDLLLPGISQVDGVKTLVSVEAKADESFGSRIIARRARREATPGSRIPERVDRLVTALFGQMTSEVAKVRYQLCHAIGSTLVDAHRYGFRRAVVLVHEFHSSTCKATKLEGNHRDLQDFIRLLPRSDHSVKTQSQLAAPFIVGPFHATGDPPERAAEEFFLPPDIPLFIGNLVTTLS